MKTCKYCDSAAKYISKDGVCENCRHKEPLRSRFAKARDDLREKLGLERLGAK